MQIFAFGTFAFRIERQRLAQNRNRFIKPSQLFVSQTEVIQRVEVIFGYGENFLVVFRCGLIIVQFFGDVAHVVQRVDVFRLQCQKRDKRVPRVFILLKLEVELGDFQPRAACIRPNGDSGLVCNKCIA